MLLITHDLGVVAERADEVAVMYAGKIVESAKPRRHFLSPEASLHDRAAALDAGHAAPRKRRLEAIPGMVPNPLRLADRLPFRDRCARADEALCAEPQPPLLEIERAPSRRLLQGCVSMPLLEVRDLKKYFPVRRRPVARGAQEHVKAIDGVELRRRRTARRSGWSASRAAARPRSAAACAADRADQRAPSRSRASDLSSHVRDRALREMRRKMQIIFQDPYASLDPRMRVGDIIGEGLRIHGIGQGPAISRHRVLDLLMRVGLRAEYYRALSARVLGRAAPAHRHCAGAGGERQVHRGRRAGRQRSTSRSRRRS